MERVHSLAALVVLLAVSLACKGMKKNDETSPASATTSSAAATPTAIDTAAATAAAPAIASASASAVETAAPPVKLENCGERYAAPARIDGKCADYCGGDYKCGPDETCTSTSWPTKSGVRNTRVCAPKGVKVRAPVAGAPWDDNGPAAGGASAAASASTSNAGAPADHDGEVDAKGGKCPAGWSLAEEACHKPCTRDSECNPPKSFCKKWQNKKLCAFTGSLVVPND
ncbi:MAG TPA: hypothetical protein VLM85_11410 [Polyangiaceae bacterium]|nr:hypothetical protein [Polyangiaceae bacterium]